MRPAWDELRMNPNRPISRNDRFGTDSMIGTSQSNADRPMELDLRSRRRSVSGLDRPKAITGPVSHIKSQILDEISPGTIEIPNSMCLGLAEGATGT